MRFSIIVPIYNVEKYLKQCVESVLSQDYKDFELILVDDGSMDSCPVICDEYAKLDRRVIVVHKENGGLSDARNTGIMQAKGDFICFIDSDDYWNSKTVLSRVGQVIEESDVDIIHSCSELYYQKEDRFVAKKRDFTNYVGLTPEQTLRRLVSEGKIKVSACSYFISREFMLSNRLLFKKGIKSEDIEWAIRMFAVEPRWCLLEDCFYVYRQQREGSITATIDYKHLSDYCETLQSSIDVANGCKPQIKEALLSYIMYQVLIASALSYRTEMTRQQRKEIQRKLSNICKGNITKYTLNSRVKLASQVYRVFGYKGMARVVGFYLIHRVR